MKANAVWYKYTSSLDNIKIGKDAINNHPEDDEGDAPNQKNQFSSEKKRIRASSFIDQSHCKIPNLIIQNKVDIFTCFLLSGLLNSLF